jgi:hypothetical protein
VPILRQIYDKLVEPHSSRPPASDKDGLMRTCKEDTYSYICTQITARGLAKALPCALVEVPQAYFSVTVSMIMQKASPYKRLLNRRRVTRRFLQPSCDCHEMSLLGPVRKASARGHSWATPFLGDMQLNTGTWPSRLGKSQMRQ